ncbi:MAG: glycosyltransferase family 4 protein, partial [Nitrospinae bacterium]|nr:glycosyltransferase family 4 protein [Nitrospinota bacterium]
DGWGSYAVNLIEHLSKQGVDCLVLSSTRSQQNDLSSIKDYKILPPLFVSRWIKIYFLIKNFYQIRKFIQSADMVHILAEPYSLISYWTCRKRPTLITLHGTYAVDALNKWYLRGLYKRVYKNAKKIICVSRFTQQVFLKKVQVDNTIVINNGIDYKKFRMYQDERKTKNNNKKIISVGALVFRKGYYIAISAVGKVVKKYSNLKYYIVGNQKNKKYFSQLKDLVKKYNLEDNIVFLQNISERKLLKLYHQADLFLLTPVNIDNNFEGFGLVYLEANACGKPVIGTYGCGAEDAIIDGFNGLLVPQNDIEKTSQAILNILDNPSLAEKLSQNGLKQAQKMDWPNMVEQYIQVYDFKI